MAINLQTTSDTHQKLYFCIARCEEFVCDLIKGLGPFQELANNEVEFTHKTQIIKILQDKL